MEDSTGTVVDVSCSTVDGSELVKGDEVSCELDKGDGAGSELVEEDEIDSAVLVTATEVEGVCDGTSIEDKVDVVGAASLVDRSRAEVVEGSSTEDVDSTTDSTTDSRLEVKVGAISVTDDEAVEDGSGEYRAVDRVVKVDDVASVGDEVEANTSLVVLELDGNTSKV